MCVVNIKNWDGIQAQTIHPLTIFAILIAEDLHFERFLSILEMIVEELFPISAPNFDFQEIKLCHD